MKPFFLIFIFFTFAKAIYAKNIIFETSGIAKVGQDCFISVFIKDETDLNIKELHLNIFSTDINEKLLGRSNIIFTNLNKNQPFVTNVPINFENKEECKAIKNLKIHVKNCIEINQNKDQCKNLVKIKENLSGNHLINTNIIKDSSFSLGLNLSSVKLGCKYITQLTGTISKLFLTNDFFLFTISLTKRSLLL